jgi:hypothetical protein
MNERDPQPPESAVETAPSADERTPEERKHWQEPKLTFVEPTLTPHGTLTSVTGQFFGAFSPSTDD